MGMSVKNGENGYGVVIAKIGMGIGMDPTHHMPHSCTINS